MDFNIIRRTLSLELLHVFWVDKLFVGLYLVILAVRILSSEYLFKYIEAIPLVAVASNGLPVLPFLLVYSIFQSPVSIFVVDWFPFSGGQHLISLTQLTKHQLPLSNLLVIFKRMELKSQPPESFGHIFMRSLSWIQVQNAVVV